METNLNQFLLSSQKCVEKNYTNMRNKKEFELYLEFLKAFGVIDTIEISEALTVVPSEVATDGKYKRKLRAVKYTPDYKIKTGSLWIKSGIGWIESIDGYVYVAVDATRSSLLKRRVLWHTSDIMINNVETKRLYAKTFFPSKIKVPPYMRRPKEFLCMLKD